MNKKKQILLIFILITLIFSNCIDSHETDFGTIDIPEECWQYVDSSYKKIDLINTNGKIISLDKVSDKLYYRNHKLDLSEETIIIVNLPTYSSHFASQDIDLLIGISQTSDQKWDKYSFKNGFKITYEINFRNDHAVLFAFAPLYDLQSGMKEIDGINEYSIFETYTLNSTLYDSVAAITESLYPGKEFENYDSIFTSKIFINKAQGILSIQTNNGDTLYLKN